MSPPNADAALEPDKDASCPEADTWVPSGDILSEQSSEEALDSQPDSGTDVQQGTSDSIVSSGTPTTRSRAVWLKQKSKSFSDAAKKVLVAETQSFVKDAHSLAVGMVEGAQLTTQETLFLKEKLFSRRLRKGEALEADTSSFVAEASNVESENVKPVTTNSKAKVAGLPGFLGSFRRGTPTSEVSNAAAPEVVMGIDAEMLGGTPVSGAETNPLRALSRGLAAQLGTDTVTSPTRSPQRDLSPRKDGAGAGEFASPEILAPPSRLPTDALERLLSGDSDFDDDVDSDDDQVATATSTMETRPTAGEVSADSMMSKASSAPLAQRLKGLAAVRLKGLRPGWQAKAKAGSVLPTNSATPSEELAAAALDKVVETEKSFLMLPSTLANYVEIGELLVPSRVSGAGSCEAVEIATPEKPLVRQSSSGKLSDKMAQRTRGLLQQARGFGGNLATAAARAGRGDSSPSGPSGIESSNFEDSALEQHDDPAFGICAVETDEDIFSEEASEQSGCQSLPVSPSMSLARAVIPEGTDEVGEADGQEEIVVVDQDDLAEVLFDGRSTIDS